MGTWKRFWSLSRRDRNTALEAATVIAASRLGLRVVGYRRWKSFLSRFSFHNGNTSPVREVKYNVHDSADHIALIAAGAARNLFFHATCLERSLGLWWLLRRQGLDAELRIGGRKDGDRFEAHAWVECAGIALNNTGDERTEFSVFGHSSAVAARELR